MNLATLARRIAPVLPAGLSKRVKRRYHTWTKPLVSIVVPVYNVEPYIAECLESLLSQTYTHLEIVVVDDGSPDESAAIVKEFARRDRRVRLIRQENRGLGGARNRGAGEARGQLLWFVDSDDVAPPGALMNMYRSLKKSGSDFVVGSLEHWTGSMREVPPWAQRVHQERLRAVSLDEHPEVLKNVFAWTKLFHTPFYHAHVAPFPNGLYEDQAPSARAYVNGKFDVIPEVVLHWRQRNDSTSITQQKSSLKDLEERWAAIDAVDDALQGASSHLRREWEAKVVGFDMRPYYIASPRTSDEYWNVLTHRLRAFVERHGPAVFEPVPAIDRVLAAAVYHGYRDDVASLVARREVRTWKVPGRVVAGEPHIAPAYFDDLELQPHEVPTSLASDVAVVTRTDDITIDSDVVTVSGSAYLTLIDLTNSAVAITCEAVDESGQRLAMDVTVSDSPETDIRAHDPWNSHLRSGFRASIATSKLTGDTYTFEVTVNVDGFELSANLPKPPANSAGRIPAFGPWSGQGRWWATTDHLLTMARHQDRQIPVDRVEVSTRTVTLHVSPNSTVHISGITAQARDKSVRGKWDSSARTATFDLPQGNQRIDRTHWTLAATVGQDSERVTFAWAPSHTSGPTQDPEPTLVSVERQGRITATTGAVVGETSDITVEDDEFIVSGWASISQTTAQDTSVVLVDADDSLLASLPTTWHGDGGTFRAIIPRRDAAGMPWPKRSGHILALLHDGKVFRVRASRTLTEQFPTRRVTTTLAVELAATPGAGAVWCRFRAAYKDNERSRVSQQRLQDQYAAKSNDLQDTVLFESFGGRTVGDSPLGISTALGLSHPHISQLWTVDCLTREVPEGTRPVLRFSSAWYEALATSRWLVNNNNWPFFFAKKPGQVYIQTWHGTPLKKIGKDIPATSLSLSYRRLMVREAAQWDFLLAQNSFAAKAIPEALGYRGTVIEEGYPRNDSLTADSAAKKREELRARLGISDNFVVLYAPTWRDSAKGASGYERVSFLDPAVLTANDRSAQPMTVLYRGHSNTASAAATQSASFIDVTAYSDINELMLAADALITDYSSIMFDFAVTGRPIYFLVPDLDTYGSKTRGFYLDLPKIAPGPLCESTEELVDALNSDFRENWGADYDAFVSEFASLDDGNASARVVRRIFGGQNSRPSLTDPNEP